MKSQNFTLSILSLVVIAVAGCAGVPIENKNIEAAKAAYQVAAANPQVARYAPVALKEAEEMLHDVETRWQRGKLEDVDHHTYLVRQRIAIAEQRAKLNAAEDEVIKARADRNNTILEARISDAEKARRIAEQAKAEAKTLAMELSEFKAHGTVRGMVLTLGDVLFGFNQADLATGGQRVVSKLSDFLRRYAKRNIMIEGFTDSVGSADYNVALSERRANAVRTALVDRGIDPGRIQIRGYGESFPVASNSSNSGRQLNRRVEVIISDDKGQISPRTN